ncbi:MAG TPA: flagellar hook-associated protein FlgL [Bacteriovoracaceae bacterium]|nr:flagellar hook-associated protein FlgL [Bacteriovoracaceae bacterium]
MSRVSENSSVHAINYAVGKTKSKVEDLQMKGSTLKRVGKPSDDPVGNVELLAIRSQNIDAAQYLRNTNFANTQLAYTENVLEELTDILTKAKELAIGQASSIYSPEIREGVSKEIHQLRNQALSLANKRMGNRYIFAGQKILTRPFDQDGKFHGDNNKIQIEINKDVFIPVNVTGSELFFSSPKKELSKKDLELAPLPTIDRSLASVSEEPETGSSIFDELYALESALLTDNPEVIQNLLEKLDSSIDRVVAMRTTIGALSNTALNAESNIEKTKLLNEAHKSKIEDADVAELFSALQKEQNVLKATYQASSNLMNTNLMDFLR